MRGIKTCLYIKFHLFLYNKLSNDVQSKRPFDNNMDNKISSFPLVVKFSTYDYSVDP